MTGHDVRDYFFSAYRWVRRIDTVHFLAHNQVTSGCTS